MLRHQHELEVGSGIAPDVVARRGYRSVTAAEAAALGFADYQAKAGLFMPTYSLAGVQMLGMLKPDIPRIADGAPLKYEWPAGTPHLFDCHPDMLPALKRRGVDRWFSEGHKKADAAASRGLACVNIPGVWAFLRGRLVIPDLDELALDGENCYVAFDSDVTRKPSVAEALLRFCEALRRRGAHVSVAYLPEGPDGAKTGLDDFFIAGGTVDDLHALAQPWDGKGPGVYRVDSAAPGESGGDTSATYWRARAEAAEADRAALVLTIKNPDITLNELRVMVSAGTVALGKFSRDDVTDAGDAVVSSYDASNDHRARAESGKPLASINPDGTRPLVPRESVRKVMLTGVERGLIRARPIPVDRQHAGGAGYRDTAWALEPFTSLAELLNPWARYRPAEAKARKRRTVAKSCPECGGIHPIHRRDYCGGCGAVVRAQTTMPEPASETVDKITTVSDDTPPPPVLLRRYFIDGSPDEPAWLGDAPDTAPEDAFETADILSTVGNGAPDTRDDRSHSVPPSLHPEPRPHVAPWLSGFDAVPADRYTDIRRGARP